jgi:hypothetical protein
MDRVSPKPPKLCRVGSTKLRRPSLSRAQFLSQVAAELSAELFHPDEAMALLLARLETGRRVVRKARLRHLMITLGLCSLSMALVSDGDLRAPPPPSAVLSRLNCSRILPLLVEPRPRSSGSVVETMRFVARRHRSGASPFLLLDVLAAAGFSWEGAGIVLARITAHRLSEAEIATTRQARMFWVLFGEARARFAALAVMERVRPWRGDFGYFTRPQLQSLLPEVVLPDHCERHEFVANLSADGAGCLDLYSVSGLGLCRHYFRPELVPVINGASR